MLILIFFFLLFFFCVCVCVYGRRCQVKSIISHTKGWTADFFALRSCKDQTLFIPVKLINIFNIDWYIGLQYLHLRFALLVEPHRLGKLNLFLLEQLGTWSQTCPTFKMQWIKQSFSFRLKLCVQGMWNGKKFKTEGWNQPKFKCSFICTWATPIGLESLNRITKYL